MSESTPNAGEKCPACGDKGCIETGEETPYETPIETPCPACNRNKDFTGLKPAVESPAADVKERDAYAKMFAEHTKEIADLTAKLAALKDENERLKAINNGMVDNLKMWKCSNIAFDKELTTLRAENQGLVKEVEETKKAYQAVKDWAHRLDKKLAMVVERCDKEAGELPAYSFPDTLIGDLNAMDLEALKPTPEESGSDPK